MVRGMEVLDEKKSILIIDDDENICRTLTLIFNKIGYHVETVNTGSKALEKIHERFFNIALIDIKLPDIEGIELISPLKIIRPYMELIMITGQGSMETAIRALNEGASSYITKPLNMEELLAKIKELFEKQDSILRNLIKPEIIEKQKILIIDDDKNICRTLSLILNKKGFEVETAGTGYEALEKARARFFNVVILDLNLPDINGLELLEPLKNIHPDMEVMMVTDYGSMESVMHALNLGVSSYITKPLDLDEFYGKISDRLEKKKAEQVIANLAKFPSENPNPVLRVNKEKVMYVNQAGKILFKIERDSKIPEALRNIVNKAFIDNSNKILEVALENRVFSFNISPIENENYANIYGMGITEKKQTEIKLKESEERFRELYNNAQVAMYSVTLDGTPIAINDLGLSLLDYSSREEFLLKFNSFNHWANPDDRLKLMEELNQKGEIRNFQAQSLTTKSKIFWSEFSMKLHSNKKQLDAVAIDITERKRTEQKLKESEEKFRTAVRNNPDFMVFIKNDGTIFDVNRVEKEFTREMVIGQNIFNRSFYETEDQLESARKAINDSIETGKTTRFEYSQIAPDGSLSFYETRISPFGYDNEDKIISLQLVTRDITVRRKAEEELRKYRDHLEELVKERTHELKEAKDLSESIINSLPGVFYLFDDEGKFIRWNKNLIDLSEFSNEEISKMNPLDLFKGKNKNIIAKAIKDTFLKGENNVEASFTSKSGKTAPYYFTGVRIMIDDKTHLIGTGIDITERKLAEKNLERTLDA